MNNIFSDFYGVLELNNHKNFEIAVGTCSPKLPLQCQELDTNMKNVYYFWTYHPWASLEEVLEWDDMEILITAYHGRQQSRCNVDLLYSYASEIRWTIKRNVKSKVY